MKVFYCKDSEASASKQLLHDLGVDMPIVFSDELSGVHELGSDSLCSSVQVQPLSEASESLSEPQEVLSDSSIVTEIESRLNGISELLEKLKKKR